MVTVLEVDLERRRISLSMKENQPPAEKKPEPKERPSRERKPPKEKVGKRQEKFVNNPFYDAFKNRNK